MGVCNGGMTTPASHYCENPDYPGGRILCLCVRGEDHPERLFDVPVGDEDEDE